MARHLFLILLTSSVMLIGCTEPLTDSDNEDSNAVDNGNDDVDAGREDTGREDTGSADTGSDTSQDVVTTPPGPGTPIGTFENTYYYLAEEGAHSGPAEATLYDSSCDPIAVVSSSFADAACIEGTARLDDGRVINYYQPCSCGGPCSYCWSVMDPDQFPWGMGSQVNPLEPLRSWAVDTSIIDYGTVLYVEEWDGLALPEVGELGGHTHDGCFRADDVGGAITGNHVDIFAGSRDMWQALEAIFPTWSDFVVYVDSPRCEHL